MIIINASLAHGTHSALYSSLGKILVRWIGANNQGGEQYAYGNGTRCGKYQ